MKNKRDTQISVSITDNYIPILLKTIRCNTCVGCDIFLKLCVNNKEQFVLYVSGETLINTSKIDRLLKEHVERLYIRKEDCQKFFQYLESSLKKIIHDGTLKTEEKAGIVYDLAKNIMVDVLKNPRSGENIAHSRELISNTVEFIINNKDASRSLINVLSYDYYTYTHSVNVSVLGLAFSRYLGFSIDELYSVGTGMMLHDVGKTRIVSEIVNKEGSLTEEEFEKMKEHVAFGVEILENVGGLDTRSLYSVAQHHEKYSGKGYPRGLQGEDIHKYGQLACIVDVYDALTTRRSYSDARKPFTALKMMKNEMEGSFNEKLLMHFIRFLGS
ncbi:MAG: HD domain-containing protein [Candidatus Brocadiaceae bacterium]|nr:HD domain-containing protein [Candidatus Brocadiaceae bacterium]